MVDSCLRQIAKPIAGFFSFSFLVLLWGKFTWEIKKVRNGSISTNWSPYTNDISSCPNRFLLPVIFTGHTGEHCQKWDWTVALTQQSFMFYSKALKMLSPSDPHQGEEAPPWERGWWMLILSDIRALWRLTVLTQLWFRQARLFPELRLTTRGP